ncbi:MAG: acetolactate synthase large subunit [Thalassobaculales bacterium]
MNGAESLARTLVAGGVDLCFSNPGTSEMHFVAALDRVEGIRCVLALFEGCVTAMADGYARMAEKPAATLLHLGPGLANGLANLHNARRARSPMVNVIGEHAGYHRAHDAPLTADIEALAGVYSHWVKTSPHAGQVAADGAAAIAAARTAPGRIASLILPADTAWNEGSGIAPVPPAAGPAAPSAAAIDAAAAVLRSGERTLILLGGAAVRERALMLAGRIRARTGCDIMGQMANARMERGAGRVNVERVPYPVDMALARLSGFRHVILVGAKAPVAFFAYPGKPSVLLPTGCQVHRLAEPGEDLEAALAALAESVGAAGTPPAQLQPADRPGRPSGALTVDSAAAAIGATLPEGAIVVDESVTSGRNLHPYTKGAAPHDWLQLTGGAIGIGIPLAAGAAIGAPGRPVLNLEGDGSGFYTLQALWTQARENLPVTTVIWANRSYAILHHELANVGAGNPGRKAIDMLTLDRPDPDWVSLARGFGVPGRRVDTAEDFTAALEHGFSSGGPYLIEARI